MRITSFYRLIACSFIPFFAVSCAVKQNTLSSPPPLKPSFSCSATVCYGELQSDSVISRYNTGVWQYAFNSPDSLAGVVLSFNNDDVSASYKGLEFSVPKSALPFQSMIICMIDAVDYVYQSADLNFSENDGVLIYNGSLEQGDYTICFNSQTGDIQSFEMPNMQLSIQFSDCTSISETSALNQDTSLSETYVSDTQITFSSDTLPHDNIE